MAMTLPAELLTAQDNQVRFPLVEIKVGQFNNEIPFQGQRLDEQTLTESAAAILMHSSGRLTGVYLVGGRPYFFYTDVERTAFSYIPFYVSDPNNWQADSYLRNITNLSMVELTNGDIGVVFSSNTNIDYYIYTAAGVYVRRGILKSGVAYDISPTVVRLLDNTYLAAFIRPIAIPVSNSGSYTGTVNATYVIQIETGGAVGVATFKWAKLPNTLSSPVTTASEVALAEGVNVVFPSGYTFYSGQTFTFTVTAATYATGSLLVMDIPTNGGKITINNTTYTLRTSFSVPTIANEIIIDLLSKEITAENIRCAITGTTFEGTGVGVRYTPGTQTCTDVVSVVRDTTTTNQLNFTALVRGAGVTIPVIDVNNGASIDAYTVAGGLNATMSGVTGMPNSIIYKTTSADFITWTTPEIVTVPDVVESNNKQNVYLALLTTGDVQMWFDYMSIGNSESSAVYNIYYTQSGDNGVTWSSAVEMTNFTTPSEVAKNPKLYQKTSSEVTLVFDKVRSYLQMTADTQGWDNNSTMHAAAIHFDPTTEMLYVIAQHMYAGNKNLFGVCQIDTSTWTIVNFWDNHTVPAINSKFFNVHCLHHGTKNAGKWVVAVACDNGTTVDSQIMVLNGDTNQIIYLNFYTDTKYGLKQNVAGNSPLTGRWGSEYWLDVNKTYVDLTNNRLWVLMLSNGYWDRVIRIGYFDLNQLLAPATEYTFTQVFEENVLDTISEQELMGMGIFAGDFIIDEAQSLIIISMPAAIPDWTGRIRVYTLDGLLLKDFRKSTHPNFPNNGFMAMTIYQNKIYGTFAYDSAVEEAIKRGLCEIDLASEVITYHVPPFIGDGTVFTSFDITATDDGQLIMAAENDNNVWTDGAGVAVYNINTDSWSLFNSANLPGLRSHYWGPTCYDNKNEMIYFGDVDYLSIGRVTGFSVYGKLERSYYQTGVTADLSSFTWNAEKPLVIGQTSNDASIAFDPASKAMYSFWTKWTQSDGKIFWDKESGLLDLQPYLLRGKEIICNRQMDGTPAQLTFSISNGPQFDPNNVASLLSKYIKKGKKVTLRWGELINGVPVYQELSSNFMITKSVLQYRRNTYPSLAITCEDRRTLWDEINVVATPYYDTTLPAEALEDLITKYGGFTADEVEIAPLDGGISIGIQFLDKDLQEITETIAHRFKYFIDINMNGDKVIAKKIDLTKAPDHIYTDQTKVECYSPDDSFSTFTNRVTVKGESSTDIQVLHAEERIQGYSGTVGFWKRKDEQRLYYSDDRSRRCLNPRLEVGETATSIAFMLAGKVKEYVSYEDPDHKFIDVKVEAPNLIPVILAGMALYQMGRSCPPVVVIGPGALSEPGESKRGALLKDSGLWLVLQCLSAIGNFQYDIYGTPVGYVRQTYQASANDYEFQDLLNGTIVETTIDDPLCHSVAQCQQVADFEMMIVKAQRNRLKVEKIAHIQDEPGDMLQFVHPYNNLPIKVFTTNVQRTFLLPENNEEGYFKDDIECWKV